VVASPCPPPVHLPGLGVAISDIITDADAEKCGTKLSKAKAGKGKILYSLTAMNDEFKIRLSNKGRHER
jgi:hypothetical protein